MSFRPFRIQKRGQNVGEKQNFKVFCSEMGPRVTFGPGNFKLLKGMRYGLGVSDVDAKYATFNWNFQPQETKVNISFFCPI